jgi:hypothetical protein
MLCSFVLSTCLITYRVSRFGSPKGDLYGVVPTNPADKGRELEVEIMAFIYGRAQQLKFYVSSVTLAHIIPDVPEKFAKFKVSLQMFVTLPNNDTCRYHSLAW